MGAWGYGNFQNDSARDWLGGDPTVDDVRARLAAFVPSADARACTIALAAGELVATSLGRPPPQVPPAVGRIDATTADAARAAEVAAMIEADSSLQRLFDDDGRYDAWHAEVSGLVERLRACTDPNL